MAYEPVAPFASMYMYDATQTITIDAVDQYHAVIGFSTGSHMSGWTFTASSTGAITDTANNGGTLRCTDVAHGLTTGQYISLTGMGDAAHVGSTAVTVIGADTFDCDDITYNSDGDTGNWQRGSSLTADTNSDGHYYLSWAASIQSAANNKNFKFELVKNNTDLDEFAAERKMAIQDDLGSIASGGIVEVTAGDVIWLQVEGTTDATNLVIEHANVHLYRIAPQG